MTLPAFLANRRPPRDFEAEAVAGIGALQPPSISIKAQRFHLIDSAGETITLNYFDQAVGMYVDVVVVDINPFVSKIFYAKDYDPNVDAPPDCFSDNGVAPSVSALYPQSPTCVACPKNVIGSATSKISGAPIRACQDRKKVAVLVPPDGGDMAFMLRIPPASLRNWRTYVEFVRKQDIGGRTALLTDVVTRITFDPDNQGVLFFKAVAMIDEPMSLLQDKLWAADATASVVGRNDVPRSGALPLPAAAPVTAQLAPPPPPAQPQNPPAMAFAAPSGDAAKTAFAAAHNPAQVAPAPTRGRPRKPPAAAPAAPPATAASGPQMSQAPFMQGPAAQQPAPAPAPQGAQGAQGGTFGGMAPPVQPNAEITKAVDALFAMPS